MVMADDGSGAAAVRSICSGAPTAARAPLVRFPVLQPNTNNVTHSQSPLVLIIINDVILIIKRHDFTPFSLLL